MWISIDERLPEQIYNFGGNINCVLVKWKEGAMADYLPRIQVSNTSYLARNFEGASHWMSLDDLDMAEGYNDMIRKICFEYSAGGYNSEGLMPVKTADAKLRWIIDDWAKGQVELALNKHVSLEVYEEALKVVISQDQDKHDFQMEINELKAELREAHREIDYWQNVQPRDGY